MYSKRLIGLLAAMCLLLAGLPALAQQSDDAGCDIDLSDIAVLLIEAQDAAGGGDTTTALSLLADAETQIGELREVCGGALGAFNTFTTSNGEFRFNYPSDYAFFEENRSTFIIATSEQARDLFFETGPDFPAGEQAIGVLIGTARQVGGQRDDDLAAIAASYDTQLSETGYEVGEQTETEIGGNAAIRLDFAGNTFSSTLIAIDLGNNNFAVTVGTGAADEFDALEPIILDIAASVEPAPIPEPEPITLAENFNLNNLLSFDYPAGWLISNEEFDGEDSILLASNTVTLAALQAGEPPNFRAEDIALGVIVGDIEDLTGSDADENTSLEDLAEDLDLLTGTFGTRSEVVRYGDTSVLEIEAGLEGTSLNVLVNLIELRRNNGYAIVLLIGSSNAVEENKRLLQAITQSVRFPPAGEPLGARSSGE